ncbi:TPA: hypothetical protein ACG3QP_003828 [Clostridioides difficile]|uniref:hypothetical protein n=1 Tax=Clostridioides difficile TaxID=1496 RepID=UPI000E58EBFD|nr:hypothetical protein [Clostridioides difficile]
MEILSLFWGFRLTIWNVNPPYRTSMFLLVPCFRLTIWNVNITNTWEYTNEITSFRLTMWT